MTSNRTSLYQKRRAKIIENHDLDRSIVSFQGNRKAPIAKWFKYREGFSTNLVSYSIRKFGNKSGTILDPFSGVGTTLFVGRDLGWSAVGIEVLPVGIFVCETRPAAERVVPPAFKKKIDHVASIDWTTRRDPGFAFPHIPITQYAFPESSEKAIAGYRAYVNQIEDRDIRKLLEFACFSILESISFTRKDGQYLRWDIRSGKPSIKSTFKKGKILDFNTAIREKLFEMYADILEIQAGLLTANGAPGSIDIHPGSCLEQLPKIEEESINLVVTSPPYCNRYDYTRTYALELVYLGYTNEDVKDLRQEMLSCTVENREKETQINSLYRQHNRSHIPEHVQTIFERQAALQEVLSILESFALDGRLNNTNIPKMVRNYFFEMCFVVFELSRIVKPGGYVVMVNDNVRYAGEEVPVDLILSDFAESFGFETAAIWKLRRGKGNSSQQMGTHGREELRKCVYVWKKPE